MQMASPLAAHESKVYNFPNLFQRIDEIHSLRSELGLNFEQLRLVERLYLDFVRAGGRFDTEAQAAYSAIMEKQAELCTRFQQNLLADESEITISLAESDLTGCPDDFVSATKDKDKEGNHIITLSRSLVVPFLTFSNHRDLRERY